MAIPFIAENVELTDQILQEQEKNFFAILNEIMKKAAEYRATIRVLGSVAFRLQAEDYKYIHYSNQRYLNDFDFATYGSDITAVQDLFVDLGWTENENVLRLFGDKRRIFYHPDQIIHADVFIDKLRFCHTIDLRKRLELEFPTISLTDLLLAKLQIVKINKRDLIDLLLLIRKYPLTQSAGKNAIDVQYMAKLCCSNWGWWKTVTTNLDKIRHFIPLCLEEEDAEIVKTKVATMEDQINSRNKSLRWNIRNIIGEKMKWYEDVEEVQRD